MDKIFKKVLKVLKVVTISPLNKFKGIVVRIKLNF